MIFKSFSKLFFSMSLGAWHYGHFMVNNCCHWHTWLGFTWEHISPWMFSCVFQYYFPNVRVNLAFSVSCKFKITLIWGFWRNGSPIVGLGLTSLAYITHFLYFFFLTCNFQIFLIFEIWIILANLKLMVLSLALWTFSHVH